MNDAASAVDSWTFYEEVRHMNSTAATNVKYKFINTSEMEYIFEHHAPDKWFMEQHVKRYIPSMLARVKNELGGKNPMKCNPMEIFDLLLTERFLAIFTERINRNCAKNKLKGLSSTKVRDCLIAWMLCTVYGQPVCDLFNDDFQLLFARPKAVSEEEVRTVLRGLQGDADRFKFLHEDTGLWVHEGQYDRELASLEVLVAEICSGLLFVDGASVLSIDDDQLAMRSRLAAVKMGLSHHVNPRKREGIIQVAVCESLMGFFLSSQYPLKKESADRGLITALMHLKGVHFAEGLHFSPGNIIGFDRGFISEDVLKVASEGNLGYVATVRAKRDAPFSIDKPKAGQRLLSEEGLRISEWATRKINGREHFVCASREETANKISMVMTNIPAFGPQRVTVKPIGKSYSAIFGESSHESMCVYPLPFDEYMLHEFLRSVTHLTRNQKGPSWFCLRRLRVTSTNLFRTIRIGVIMAVFEAEDDLELLKGLGFKTMTWADVAASQNGLSTNISQFRGKGKTEMTKLAESCGVVTDSSMTIAEISSALMKAKRQGEDNVNQRREYLFAKQLISAWAMKPIRSTTAMDKGKKNEPHVIRELPAFWERWAREPSCTTLEHITEIGLVVSQANPMERTRGMEATSVDGVGVRKFCNGDVEPFPIEIKMFSSQESLRKAELVLAKYGRVSFVLLREISDLQSEKGQMVRESLLKREYFVQVLNHAMVFQDGAACYGGNFVHVTFVSTLENQVQYIVYISIGLPILRHLRRMMAQVRNDFYPWTFKRPKEYPAFQQSNWVTHEATTISEAV